MSTTLLNSEISLSKQIGDYWDSTTTSAGAEGGTTVIDTELKAKSNNWIDADSAEMFDMITSGTYDEQERSISSLDNSEGTLTVLAHGGQIASGVTYRVHRLFSASEKRRALIHGAKEGFPHIHKSIWDESTAIDDDYLYKEIDISSLGLANNQPLQIWQSSDKSDDGIPWYPIRNYTIDKDGKLWLHEGICGYDLRIVGIGYLDFLAASVASTSWSATIAIDSPQLNILVAQAAIYLCDQMIMPNFTSGTNKSWIQARQYWEVQLKKRNAKFGMPVPPILVNWGV